MTLATALIIGAGAGLSASSARKLAARGHALVLAARSTADLAPLAKETGARLVEGDAATPEGIDRVFAAVDALPEPLGVAIYNRAPARGGPSSTLTARPCSTRCA